jgi:hypothetical protein
MELFWFGDVQEMNGKRIMLVWVLRRMEGYRIMLVWGCTENGRI